MNVLGLTSDFHDSSAALVKNGQLIASAAEERFTRNKHDSNFPQFSLEFCLKQGDLQPQDLDLVVFYEKPFRKWMRVLDSSLRDWPHSRAEFVESQSEWLGKKLWTKALLAKRLGLPAKKIVEIEHHRSHLIQAFVGSGFSSAAILTVDAVGENSTASFGKAYWQNDELVVEEISQAVFPHSLGLFYSAITAFLGFRPMNDECSVMALAAFGEPTYYNELKKILSLETNGFWRLDSTYLSFDRFLHEPWTANFLNLFGEPRNPSERLPFSSFSVTEVSPRARHWANLAASAQKILEEALLHSARTLLKITGEKNLCFAGGVALNCVANARLAQEANLFIPVEPGDGGASIGAAFSPKADPVPYSIYQGAAGNDLEKMLEQIDVEHSWEYQKLGAKKDWRNWRWEKLNPMALSAEVAKQLADHKVVGLFQGRFELGPRALGNRSLLFRADSIELAERVSTEIKDRAKFRPYAISLLPEEKERLLATDLAPNLLRWMQVAVPVKEKDLVRAGLHIDGSTRAQLVHATENPLYHSILTEVKNRIGVGAVINTSMNESGYPLVGSAEEALLLFARTSLDVLVIDDLIIRKE